MEFDSVRNFGVRCVRTALQRQESSAVGHARRVCNIGRREAQFEIATKPPKAGSFSIGHFVHLPFLILFGN